MTEKRKALSGVLNIRVDEALEREIERIAGLWELSASETARVLLRHGVEVERQSQASLLRLPYEWDRAKMRGRTVIEAQWVPYTRREWLGMQDPDPEEMEEKTIWFEGDTR